MGVLCDLDNIKIEFTNAENNSTWKTFFSSLKSESDKICQNIEINEAKVADNKSRNRYRDVLPYDCTRVPLLGIGESDYINANYVQLKSCKLQRRYILTQGPLPTTISHFWRMIWNEHSLCIVMLNKLIEKNMVKCALYFPSSLDETLSYDYDDLRLSISLLEVVDKGSYTKRVLFLEDKLTNETRRIVQYHYLSWPDFGVPITPVAFLEFLNDVRSSGGLDDPERPSVIHCSAGIGRSGTFILIDLALLRIVNYDGCVDLKQMLMELRQCRMGLVQAAEQLRFVYLAVMVGAKKLLAADDDREINPEDHEENIVNDNASHGTSSSSDADSDYSDSSDMMRSNSALDQAAAAVRNRRGIPLCNGLEDTIVISQSNHSNDPLRQNSTDLNILEDRKQIRESRCNRTRQKVEEIRSNMRRQDLERERILYRFGFNRLRNCLSGYKKNSVIMGASVFVGVVSMAIGFAVYKFAV